VKVSHWAVGEKDVAAAFVVAALQLAHALDVQLLGRGAGDVPKGR
jgi:hypothetical protein